MEKNTVELARRDTLQKQFVSMDEVSSLVPSLLTEIQEQLYIKALKYRDEHVTYVDDFDTFKELLDSKTGFFACHWDGTSQTEDKIKDLTKLERITNILFSNKRKMINKNISKILKKKDIKKIVDLNLNSRPEELKPDIYYKLAEFIEKDK